MAGIHISMSAWNEVLARTLDGFESQNNVSPEWLVNPATKRRLKLDKYYPDAGVAIRFAGLTAKGQKRQSDWDVLENEQRDQTRDELCRLNGVYLAVIDPIDDPLKQVDNIIMSIRRSKKQAESEKKKTVRKLERALLQAREIRSRISRNPDQVMASLAEGWRDRETRMVTELSEPSSNGAQKQKRGRKVNVAKLQQGDKIRHERFGDGEITGLSGDGDDSTISISFGLDEAGNPQDKTFLVSLVAEKIKKL